LDDLLKVDDPQKVFRQDGMLREVKKALSERIPDGELNLLLGDESAVGRERPQRAQQQDVADGLREIAIVYSTRSPKAF